MKTTKIILGLTFLMLVSKSNAQNSNSDSKCRMVVTSAMIQAGTTNALQPPSSLDDFKKLAPNSSILSQDFSAYTARRGFAMNSGQFFNAMVGISFKDKEHNNLKSNPLLRLGISYYSGSGMSSGLGYELSKPYDTLTSSQTGTSVYIDSIYSKRVNMNYQYQQVRLDGSLIFRTKPEERWSLYGGLGFSLGASINANTNITSRSFASVSSANISPIINPGPIGTMSSSDVVNEAFRNKTNFGGSVYLPVGVDFRIGKKREFWKQMHLFYEFRPGVNLLSIPELGSITTATVQHGIGLKVNW